MIFLDLAIYNYDFGRKNTKTNEDDAHERRAKRRNAEQNERNRRSKNLNRCYIISARGFYTRQQITTTGMKERVLGDIMYDVFYKDNHIRLIKVWFGTYVNGFACQDITETTYSNENDLIQDQSDVEVDL
jgi:hypothetical protein